MKIIELFEALGKEIDLTRSQEGALANEIGDLLGFDVEVTYVGDLGDGVMTARFGWDDPKTERARTGSMKFKGTFKAHSVEDFTEVK